MRRSILKICSLLLEEIVSLLEIKNIIKYRNNSSFFVNTLKVAIVLMLCISPIHKSSAQNYSVVGSLYEIKNRTINEVFSTRNVDGYLDLYDAELGFYKKSKHRLYFLSYNFGYTRFGSDDYFNSKVTSMYASPERYHSVKFGLGNTYQLNKKTNIIVSTYLSFGRLNPSILTFKIVNEETSIKEQEQKTTNPYRTDYAVGIKTALEYSIFKSVYFGFDVSASLNLELTKGFSENYTIYYSNGTILQEFKTSSQINESYLNTELFRPSLYLRVLL